MKQNEINRIMSDVETALRKRLAKHGEAPFSSRHETLGVVTEEYYELCDAIRNDKDHERFKDELMDVAIACIFGLHSEKLEEENGPLWVPATWVPDAKKES